VLASLRALALLAWTGILLPPCLSWWMLCGRAPRRIVRLWHRGCCRIAGLQVRVRGAPEVRGPTLFVANHVSYLDIVVLGSLVDATFVAKSEIAVWPLIGLLARIGRTVFIHRRAAYCAGQCDALAARLEAGQSLILFAEGTSSDGGRVLPSRVPCSLRSSGRRPARRCGSNRSRSPMSASGAGYRSTMRCGRSMPGTVTCDWRRTCGRRSACPAQ
jgi:1-acyl-sn-glycerol-3-phosphate acyltransferase